MPRSVSPLRAFAYTLPLAFSFLIAGTDLSRGVYESQPWCVRNPDRVALLTGLHARAGCDGAGKFSGAVENFDSADAHQPGSRRLAAHRQSVGGGRFRKLCTWTNR